MICSERSMGWSGFTEVAGPLLKASPNDSPRASPTYHVPTTFEAQRAHETIRIQYVSHAQDPRCHNPVPHALDTSFYTYCDNLEAGISSISRARNRGPSFRSLAPTFSKRSFRARYHRSSTYKGPIEKHIRVCGWIKGCTTRQGCKQSVGCSEEAAGEPRQLFKAGGKQNTSLLLELIQEERLILD